MIEARVVTRETLGAVMWLRVRDDQSGFVATNAVTLAQVAYEPSGAHVWGLWAGDLAVGLMAMIDPRHYPFMEEGDDLGASFIWRLMVSAEAQGRGVGRAAIGFARDQTREWGLPRITVSCVDAPGGPRRFYEAQGFVATGRIVDGEVELIRNA